MTVHFIWNIIITVAKLPLVLSFHCHFYWIFFLKNGILKCLSCSFSFITLTFYRIIIIVGNPRIGSPLCDMIGVSSLYRFNINKMHIQCSLSPSPLRILPLPILYLPQFLPIHIPTFQMIFHTKTCPHCFSTSYRTFVWIFTFYLQNWIIQYQSINSFFFFFHWLFMGE